MFFILKSGFRGRAGPGGHFCEIDVLYTHTQRLSWSGRYKQRADTRVVLPDAVAVILSISEETGRSMTYPDGPQHGYCTNGSPEVCKDSAMKALGNKESPK